jgi:peptide deformylase
MAEPTGKVLKIIQYGHPTLRVRCDPVTEFTPELKELAEAMFQTMEANEGVGLAASQVDQRIRLLVVNVPKKDSEEVTRVAAVNPEVLEVEGEWEYEEGCLSIPDIRDNVVRPERIKLRYQDLDGEAHELEATGLLSRVFLHEIDHLNGVLFVDYLSPVRRMIHSGKLKRMAKETAEQLGQEA